MPPIDIDVDNSSHCYLVDEYIRGSLETCFPLPKSIKKEEFISDSTFALTLHGHGLAKLMLKSDWCFDKTLLLAIFGFWAHHALASAMVYLETRKHLHSRIKYDTCYGLVGNLTLSSTYILDKSARSMYSLSKVLLLLKNLLVLTSKLTSWKLNSTIMTS